MIANIIYVALFFGQSSGVDIPQPSDPWGFLGSLVGNLTGFAFAGWLAHHLLTVVIPRMQQAHNETQEKMAASYTSSLEHQAKIFAEASTQNVDKFREALEADRRFREQELELLKEQVRNTVGQACKYHGETSLTQLPVQTIQKGNP